MRRVRRTGATPRTVRVLVQPTDGRAARGVIPPRPVSSSLMIRRSTLDPAQLTLFWAAVEEDVTSGAESIAGYPVFVSESADRDGETVAEPAGVTHELPIASTPPLSFIRLRARDVDGNLSR